MVALALVVVQVVGVGVVLAAPVALEIVLLI
jgi:hypothetical protein